MSSATSSQQDQAVEFFKSGTGNGVIEAVAGSGKTTTLLKMFDYKPASKRIAYVCYNRANADEAKAKTGFRPGVYINTAHGFGMKAWRDAYPKAVLDGNGKWEMIAFKLGLFTIDEKTKRKKWDQSAETVRELISFAKDNALGVVGDAKDIENWLGIVEHFSLEQNFATDGVLPHNIDELILEACRKAFVGLKIGIDLSDTIIDFDDMIYMPLIKNLRMLQYHYVFVDEAQDTNTSRRELYKRMMTDDGRLIAVGDRHQAIYGFTGADANSLDLIREQFQAKSLSLNVSYRCPKEVVRVAKRYVSHIESHESADDGYTAAIRHDDLIHDTELVLGEDAIVCRNTAPLVGLAYSFIRKGIPCHIEGKKIGEGLVKLTKQWSRVKTVGAFLNKLEQYVIKSVSNFTKKGREDKAAELIDKRETILVIAEMISLDAPLTLLQQKISDLFADTENGDKKTLNLCTIHKSKGREWNRVFWYGANRFQPSPYATQDWQLEQENNLCYVAATRAKHSLIEVAAPPRNKR